MPGLLGTSLTTDEMWDTLKSIGRGINLGGTAGLLGGPVDMATMLLNNPGMLHPGLLGAQGLGIEKPVMGSKWIESKLQPAGLLPQRQGNWQEGVGELASAFINPATAAYAAGPKLYAMESQMMDNAMAPARASKQAGALFPPGTPKQEIPRAADSLAEKARASGFEVSVDHSGSAYGPSSYVNIFDPQTGRTMNDLRFSSHSKGPWNAQFVRDVNADDIPGLLGSLEEMRAKGPTALMLKRVADQQAFEMKIAEKIARIKQKELAGEPLSGMDKKFLRSHEK